MRKVVLRKIDGPAGETGVKGKVYHDNFRKDCSYTLYLTSKPSVKEYCWFVSLSGNEFYHTGRLTSVRGTKLVSGSNVYIITYLDSPQ